MTPTEAHCAARANDLMPIWTVYDHPTDYPDGFVARMGIVGQKISGQTQMAVFAETLDGVRALLPPGLFRLERDKHDDPVIVETWV